MASTKYEFPIAAVSNTRTQIIDSMKKLEAYPLQLTSQTLSTILQDFTEREELRSFNTMEISFLSQHYESNPTFFWRWLIPRIKAISRSQDVGKNVNYFRELFSETYWLLIDKETAADLISDMGSGTVLFSTSRSDKDAILVSSIVEEDRVQHWKHLMTPLITPITALLDHLKDRWTMDQIRLFQYKTSATHSIADIISAINKRKAYGESTLHPVKVRRVSGRDDVSRSSAADSESRRLSADYSGQLSPNSSWSEAPSPFYDPHSISGESHMVEANSPNPMAFQDQQPNMNTSQSFPAQMYNPANQQQGMIQQNSFQGTNQFQPANAKQAPHMQQGNPRLQQQRAFQEQLHQQPQMHNPFQQPPPHMQQPGGQQQYFQPIKEENPFEYHQYQMSNDMNAPFWGTNSANNSSENLNMNVNQQQMQQQQGNQNQQMNPQYQATRTKMDLLPLAEAKVFYKSDFISQEDAKRYYTALLSLPYAEKGLVSKNYDPVTNTEVAETKTNANKQSSKAPPGYYRLNRRTCALGDQEVINKAPPAIWGTDVINPWTEEAKEIKDAIEKITGDTYNVCLVNFYKDGNDTIGTHSDNEELGDTRSIASISLGAERLFFLRAKNSKERYEVRLANGSLLVMKDKCQENYLHGVPAERSITQGRINLTFRKFLYPNVVSKDPSETN